MQAKRQIDSVELEKAAERCKASLGRAPNDVALLSELASIRGRQGFVESALAGFELAIQLRPDLAALYFNRANTFRAAGRFEEAAASYRRAIELQPCFPEAFQNLGDVLAEAGKSTDAIDAYMKSLQLRPDTIAVLNNLANTLLGLGRRLEAESALRRAVFLEPRIPELHNNLGNLLRELESWEAAEQAYRTALNLAPSHPESLVNLGSLLIQCRRSEEALTLIEQAAQLFPNHGQVLGDLAHQLQSTARWEKLPSVCRKLEAIVESDSESPISTPTNRVSPQTFLSLAVGTTRRGQLKCARRWSQSRFRRQLGWQSRSPNTNRNRTKLRIGYISADFHAHPVGFAMVEVIESHNRRDFEIFGYSVGSIRPDEQAAKLIQAFVRFRVFDSKLSHEQAAQAIIDDEIDILVDLQGYTPGCRSEILALRPAPIQASYLGFPGTMGADFIDYLIADRYVVPNEHQPDYHEKLVYLPGCFMASDSRLGSTAITPSRKELGLPEEFFVFCAFSMPFKITQPMFECWLRILKSTPKSVLWLRDWDTGARQRLKQHAALSGVDPSRLIFAPMTELTLHLARHRAADLYLDTFPYNQHSTAGDALRTGLPLLTLSGETFASRVAGSFLTSLGLPELIARDLDEYESIAKKLATSPSIIGELRSRLDIRLRVGEVFSGAMTARKLEQGYREMWELHRQALPPRTLQVEPEEKAEVESGLELLLIANQLLQHGRYGEAEASYRKILLREPNSPAVHSNLGATLRAAGRWEEAIDCFIAALQVQPDFVDARLNLGTTYQDLDRPREALDAFQAALRLQPDNVEILSYVVHLQQKLCDWSNLDSLNDRIIRHLDTEDVESSGTLIPPFATLVLHKPTTALQQLRCNRAWTEGPNGVLKGLKRRDFFPDGDVQASGSEVIANANPAASVARLQGTKRLKIGYLSSEFRYHPTAFLVSTLFAAHDRSTFEISAYSYGPNDQSLYRKRVETGADRFVDIADLSFAEAAELIRRDAIDILVDLTGITQLARTEILGFRPAPIQVNYLGYPSTMGSECVDYIIVDDFVVPAAQQRAFTEKIIAIPGCYQVNENWTPIARPTTIRRDHGLPEQGVVFCDFNASFKISERVFAVWMSLLRDVSGSVLWLMESHPEAVVNLRHHAVRFGVAADRLVFAPSVPRDEHLSRMAHADLFLDTFPYSAHTTGSDALRAGLPLLTLVGETFASRVAGSLLNTLGIHELITTTPQEYHDRALQLAKDPAELRRLRDCIQERCRTSDLFNTAAFARKIEAAFSSMWSDYRIKPMRPMLGR